MFAIEPPKDRYNYGQLEGKAKVPKEMADNLPRLARLSTSCKSRKKTTARRKTGSRELTPPLRRRSRRLPIPPSRRLRPAVSCRSVTTAAWKSNTAR
jgi:hypothetical protein